MRQSVLVPLDFSRDADRALPVAESLAQRIDARLDVVSLTSPGIDPVHDMTEARSHAREMGVDVDAIHVRHDDDVVAGVLTMAADDRAVLCCSTHARGRLGEWLLHSASAEIVRRSIEPLVLVGPAVELDPRPSFTEVLACVDRSSLTPRIASTAAAWSRRLSTKVRLLEVVAGQADMPAAWESTKRLATTLTCLGVDTMPEVLVADDPAEAIVHTARQLASPLLVVGTHDHRDADHPALGRVSLAVVRRSPYPVVVVPSDAVAGRR
jgi:nucleotide-binding universal stress UspA family protein